MSQQQPSRDPPDDQSAHGSSYSPDPAAEAGFSTTRPGAKEADPLSYSPNPMGKHLPKTESIQQTKSSCSPEQHTKVSKPKITILKEPGWRLSSNSKLKVTVPTRTRSASNTQLDMNSPVKSDTSISSNGPLRQFYRSSNDRLKRQPKVHFQPDPKLIKEAVEVSVNLEKLSVPNRGDSTGKVTCPVDPNGGFIGSSNLDHIKMVTYDDDEDDPGSASDIVEKSNRSGKTSRPNENNGGKSKSSKAVPKTAPFQTNTEIGGSPPPPSST